MKIGKAITAPYSTTPAVGQEIPAKTNGENARFIYVACSGSGVFVAFGDETVTADSGTNRILVVENCPVILDVQGILGSGDLRYIGFVGATATGAICIGTLENG